MSDISELLDRTARSVEVPPSAETVEADLRRGRAALSRRRRGRAIGLSVAAAVTAVAVVGTTVLVGNSGRTDRISAPSPSSTVGAVPSPGADRGVPVELVAYHGEQLEGFVVDQVPEGWFLQGSNPYSLTIAPQGDTTSPDAFVGKLVVMLLSSSAPQRLPQGDPIEVGGNPGVISHGPPADTLTYRDDAGHLVQVQAWTSALRWSDEQLISFAEGVQVTSHAQAGVG